MSTALPSRVVAASGHLMVMGHYCGLVTEANRIKLAHLFDPCLAIHTSDWRQGPATDDGRHLPHQNGENCRRQKQAGC